jgi:hypothetical protein
MRPSIGPLLAALCFAVSSPAAAQVQSLSEAPLSLPAPVETASIEAQPQAVSALPVELAVGAPVESLSSLSPLRAEMPAAAAKVRALPAAAERGEPRATLFSRVAQAAARGLFNSPDSRFFDRGSSYASAIFAPAQTDLELRGGVRLDARPRAPKDGGVNLQQFHVSPERPLEDGTSPITLNADPKDPSSVEDALRKLVESDPARYGASSGDMAKVHVKLLPGDASRGTADTYAAVFRQWKKGKDRDGSPYYLLVDGANLTFHVKVLQGKPVVMAVEGRMFPGVDARIMTPGFSDEELARKAQERLMTPRSSKARRLFQSFASRLARGMSLNDERPPRLITREIMNANGRWRALNIYDATDLRGQPVIVAVDVRSGEAFAWDDRSLARGEQSQQRGVPSLSGVATAKGETLTLEGNDHGPIKELPLPFAKVFDEEGKVLGLTGEDGSFQVPASGAAPVKLTVRLDGKYGPVLDGDEKNSPVQMTVSARPGEKIKLTLNAEADDEERTADVNGYLTVPEHITWLKEKAGIDDERMHKPMAGGIRTNKTDMPGNAYYDPATDSINYERAATVRAKMRGPDGKLHRVKLSFENTAERSIGFHELTHRVVGMFAQIELSAEQLAQPAFRFVSKIMDPVMDGGVNEAIADIVSMFMRGSPIIGNGFMTQPPVLDEGPAPARGKGKGAVRRIVQNPEAAAGQEGIDYVRTGENRTKVDPKDPRNSDPHFRGEPLIGFAWNVRKSESDAAWHDHVVPLIVRTILYLQPQDVPSAMLHVLLAGMTNDGRLLHDSLIRDEAQDRGVELPPPPPSTPST